MTADAARLRGAHVASKMAIGFYTAAQLNNISSNGVPSFQPRLVVDVRVVGLVVFNTLVIHDDIDQYPTYFLYTPALTKVLLRPPFVGAEGWTFYGIQVDHASAEVATVEREIGDAMPHGTLLLYHATSLIESEAQRALAPEVVVLWLLGVLAGLGVLLLVLQAVARQVQATGGEQEVLGALGADRRVAMSDSMIGIVSAIVVGSVQRHLRDCAREQPL